MARLAKWGDFVSGSTTITCDPRGFVYIASEANPMNLHKATSRLKEAPSGAFNQVSTPSALLD